MISSIALFTTLVVPVDTVREVAVTIAGPVDLPGILTMPEGAGPFPAAVIIHGSGPVDRDLTIGPNKPYRDIAYGLAERGIAVLRYDKRSRVAPAWFGGRTFTVRDEVIDDAVAAFELLRASEGIDGSRLFVIGHSLGGYAAPRIAAADGGLAGMILMAGAWVTPLDKAVIQQIDYVASVAATPAESAAVLQARPMVVAMSEAAALITEADSASLTMYLGAPASYWLDLRAHEGVDNLAARPEPALILQGERDYQIPPRELDAFLARLGDRRSTTVIRYPALNHLFLAGEGPPKPTEYLVAGKVDTKVLDDIAGWIKKVRSEK